MRYTALVLLALIGCATPPPAPTGVQITVSVERAESCKAAGGCGLLSMAEVASIQSSAYALGVRQGVKDIEGALDSNGCRRDKI